VIGGLGPAASGRRARQARGPGSGAFASRRRIPPRRGRGPRCRSQARHQRRRPRAGRIAADASSSACSRLIRSPSCACWASARACSIERSCASPLEPYSMAAGEGRGFPAARSRCASPRGLRTRRALVAARRAHGEQARLAAAVGTDQAQAPAVVDLQVDVLEQRLAARARVSERSWITSTAPRSGARRFRSPARTAHQRGRSIRRKGAIRADQRVAVFGLCLGHRDLSVEQRSLRVEHLEIAGVAAFVTDGARGRRIVAQRGHLPVQDLETLTRASARP